MFKDLKNSVDKNKLKRSLVESIEKNNSCMDYLSEELSRLENIYLLTESKEDKANYQKVQWILFQINYNTDLMAKQLKKMGGNADELQSFKWE